MARHVFRQVHIGYLAAIVAASNAGGSGSVVGDTTTTMMWIAGVSPLSVLEAYIAAGVALLVFGIPAALQQQTILPIVKHPRTGLRIRLDSRRNCCGYPLGCARRQRDSEPEISRAGSTYSR